jgi:hypothetical protein
VEVVMKGSRVLLVALSLSEVSLVGCGSSTGCPNGYEVLMGMCVPEGSVRPDAAMAGDAGMPGADDAWAMPGDDAAMGDTSMASADAGMPEAMPDAAVPPDTGCPHPLLFADLDGDGFGDPSAPLGECAESRAGYVLDATDCSDTCASCHPGGPETCNGADDDCDAMIDDGVMSSFYADADGDGFGTGSAVSACSAPAGHTATAGDCNDACASCRPGGTETCNGADDDCDGSVDDGVLLSFYVDADGDGFGTGSVVSACSAPAGHTATAGDCNDGCASCRPGGTETCNGADDDCDGATDDGVTTTFYLDADGDTYGRTDRTTQACTQPAGHAARGGDCDDASSTANPGATEICDGRDNDCDGGNDEGVMTTYYRDADGDAYGRADMTTQACSAPSGYVGTTGDCNDGSTSIRPGAAETCNDVDDDCDAVADDGLPLATYYADCDRDGFTPMPVTTMTACRAPTTAPAICPTGQWLAAPSSLGDCVDQNATVFPGQTAYFTTAITPTQPAGREYDYDCSGGTTQQYPRSSNGMCGSCDTSGATGWSGTVRSCGAGGTYLTCSLVPGLGCSSSSTTRTQGCR